VFAEVLHHGVEFWYSARDEKKWKKYIFRVFLHVEFNVDAMMGTRHKIDC